MKEERPFAHDGSAFFSVVTVWSGIWLVLTWFLEHLRQGFVVNWINIKWVVVLFVASGVLSFIFKTRGVSSASHE